MKDIWLGGNFYGLKPQFGRHDSSLGVFLKGEGKQQFKYINQEQIGIKVKGEVRDAWSMKFNGKTRVMVARNNDKTLIFSN